MPLLPRPAPVAPRPVTVVVGSLPAVESAVTGADEPLTTVEPAISTVDAPLTWSTWLLELRSQRKTQAGQVAGVEPDAANAERLAATS